MPDRQAATHGRDQQEASSGYFAPLERVKCMLLTTFERDGTPVSAPVRGVVDGDRVYFRAWSRSGSVQRLRHTDAVQVTPCSARGLFTYGPPLEATARPLPDEEADRAAGKLARGHPVQHRFLIPLLHRTRRRQMVHYELLADDAAGDQGQCPEGSRGPDRRGDQPREHAVRQSRDVTRIQRVRAHVTDHGIASIACIWPASTGQAGQKNASNIKIARRESPQKPHPSSTRHAER
jgi:PPOX class probable F420-dependent enzyme